MKRFYSRVFIISILALVCISGYASDRNGWGISGTIGAGNFDLTSKPYLLDERKASGTYKKAGAAIVYDSAKLTEYPVNFRFSMGFEKAQLDSDQFAGSESFYSFNIDLVPSIWLYDQSVFGLWLGPQFRFGLVQGSGDDFTKDATTRTFGIGVSLGTTFHIGDKNDLIVSAGALNENFIYNNQNLSTRLDGRTSSVYFMTALLFRID